MKFAYKVWHSEADKWEAKKLAGQKLGDDEIAGMHERLHELVAVNYESEAAFTASVVMLDPSVRGVVVVLETLAGTENEADDSIARCLGRINGLDPDLCFMAKPVPRSDQGDGPGMETKLDLLRSLDRSRTINHPLESAQAEHVYLSLPGELPDAEVGRTFQHPMRVHATAANIGIPHEYAKLTQLFGEMGREWSVASRSIADNEHGRKIETFHLQLADRTELDFHFDVTSFYRN